MENKELQFLIYSTPQEDVKINAVVKSETIWLTQKAMAELFGVNPPAINKHLTNIFNEGELQREATVSILEIVQSEGNRSIKRNIDFYNLDAIISVGYRVNSSKATKFRIWATSVLKEHIIQGYTINKKRLEQLNKTIEIISRSYIPEISGIANILQNFTKGLDLLDNYDHQEFSKPKSKNKGKWQLTYKEARKFIDSMKFGNESTLFGREKDDSFKSSLGAIYQTFAGKELYPSIQEKAANLLYLVVKNHSFTDGNKRIAAALFVYFLNKNKVLKDKSGQFLIDNNALAATTLMIALSKPQEKEIMCNLVINFLS